MQQNRKQNPSRTFATFVQNLAKIIVPMGDEFRGTASDKPSQPRGGVTQNRGPNFRDLTPNSVFGKLLMVQITVSTYST